MSDPIHVTGLLAEGWKDLPFVPFRPGIEIAWLQQGAPGVAVLRYAPGAQVPLHRHPDTETILVLDGSQSDEHGTYGPGALVINPKGSQHRVWSDNGCIVLLQWTQPVEFLEEA